MFVTLAFAGTEYIIKAANVLPPTDTTNQATLWWADEVEKRTEGRVKIEVYPSGQLGTAVDNFEQAKMGANVMATTQPGFLVIKWQSFRSYWAPFF